MKIQILLFFFVFLSIETSAQILGKDITLKSESIEIKGTLLCPENSEKIPLAIIISGSGPTDRDGNNPKMTNNSLKMLVESLYNNGIATVRYDKRGIGESTIINFNEKDLRFENYITDAENWVELLKNDARFSKIIIIGHSEGSLIGMIASQNKAVDKFISVAGISSNAGDLIIEQLKAQPVYVQELCAPIIDKLKNGDTVENVPPMLYSLFRPSVQPYMISWFRYDPKVEIKKLSIPILITQGSTDIQVKTEEAEKLKEANENSDIKIIEGMNHILKESVIDRQKNMQTYTNPNLKIKEELVSIIVEFIMEK